VENPATPVVENPVTPEAPAAPVSAVPATPATPTGWKSGIRTDLRDSPLLQKFDDSPAGLEKALESYGNLEKLLGHEKVPIPKDANDIEGWNRFSKAMGIPDKAEGYGLADAKLPESMKGMTLDKNKFAEIAHAHKLTPAQVKGLWDTYNQTQIDSYNKHMDGLQKNLEKTINTLKGEWGDTYATNIELGQQVINDFSADKEMNDFLTASLLQDPRGVKFLAKLGEQFAENKIGTFSAKRFTLAPEQAKEEWQKIVKDPNHPYNNDKASESERKTAVDYVNSLIATIKRAQG
jgi:hypothetical protein